VLTVLCIEQKLHLLPQGPDHIARAVWKEKLGCSVTWVQLHPYFLAQTLERWVPGEGPWSEGKGSRSGGDPVSSQMVVISLEPVAHACNPSYSGGRNQEDQSSKPALGK
jgi:hypothetical protein